jgi:hypothetical protein
MVSLSYRTIGYKETLIMAALPLSPNTNWNTITTSTNNSGTITYSSPNNSNIYPVYANQSLYGIGSTSIPIGTVTTSTSGNYSFAIPDYEIFFENFGWLVEQLSYTQFPRKINAKVCAVCKQSTEVHLDVQEVYKKKCIFCHKTCKILFVWKDNPPESCPYELEHVLSKDDESDFKC